MSKFVRLCEACKKESIGNPTLSSSLRGCGYSTYLKEDDYTCEDCGGTVIDLNMSVEDYRILIKISNEPKFIESMIQLQESDIIEYNLKMSQFRAQVPKQSNNTVKCPKCGSTNIQVVPRKWSLLTGFMTNKTDRVCVNCKNKF